MSNVDLLFINYLIKGRLLFDKHVWATMVVRIYAFVSGMFSFAYSG